MNILPTSLIKVCSLYITPKKERNIFNLHVAEMQVFKLCTRTEPKKNMSRIESITHCVTCWNTIFKNTKFDDETSKLFINFLNEILPSTTNLEPHTNSISI
jgi:hypothetical protein